jgi:hypothetical protein
MATPAPSEIRTNTTGATRDSAEGKNCYEGFLSPLVLESFGDYMTEHRRQSDGSLRAPDNWQKGMPLAWYRDSLIRHVFTAWSLWRGWPVREEKIGGVMRQPTLIETLNGILFNTMGMMHELLKARMVEGQGPVAVKPAPLVIIPSSTGIATYEPTKDLNVHLRDAEVGSAMPYARGFRV